MIYPELDYVTGRTGHIFLTIYAVDGTTVIRARSATGIVEAGSSGAYILAGGLAVAAGLVVWDDDLAVLGGEVLVEPTDVTVAPTVVPGPGFSGPSNTWVWKRGDTDPIIYPVTVLDTGGNPVVVDVTGWSGKFKMRSHPNDGPGLLINDDFYISDALGQPTADGSSGRLAYLPDNSTGRSDTKVTGKYLGEFEAIKRDGTKQTYPTTLDTSETKAYIQITIEDDLDNAVAI